MIVITGAAGLIGSAVVRELNQRGFKDLILVDHLGLSEKWHNLRSLSYREYFEKDHFREMVYEFMCNPFTLDTKAEGSGTNSSYISLDLNQVDCIIHLGANSSTTEKDASHLIDNNYRYSIEMALLASRLGIRFVYASSAATYGDGELGFEDRFDDYLHTLRPLNAYGYSKHAFDLYLRDTNLKLSFAGIKYFNVYGPGEYHKGEMRSVVHKSFEQIRETGKMQLFKSYRDDYKDGEQKRDFLYVRDAAKMTVFLAIENQSAIGVFNAGSGQASTWLELGYAIFEAMNMKAKIDFCDMPDFLRPKYQYYTCAPIDRIQTAGYKHAATPLTVAVKDYVQNYLMQADPYA